MKPLQNHETDNYSLEIRGRLAVLNLKNDAFALSTSLDVKRNYMGLLEAVDASPDLHALLILGRPDGLGCDEFRRFLVEAAEGETAAPDGSGSAAMSTRVHRFKNGLNHFVRTASTYRKILAVGLRGEVVPPFFAVCQAADYVYAAQDMTFVPAHLELGTLPGGCLMPFPGSVDPRDIRDLMFSTRPTAASELQRRGLVDECLPTESFEEECIRKADELAQLPLAVITEVKALMRARGA